MNVMTVASYFIFIFKYHSGLLRMIFVFLSQDGDDDDDPAMLHVVHLGVV